MNSRTLTASFALLLALFVTGLRADDSKPATQPAADLPNTGIIKGKVIYSGKPPALHPFQGKCCGHDQLCADETFVLAADKSLRDVVVYLKDAPDSPPGKPETVVVLDQKDCAYVPHVVALQAGQTLRITSSDPTEHNVHGIADDNPPFNFSEDKPGASTDIILKKPEVFPIKCDVHTWMLAMVHVMSHPYFAVTGADGTFEIHNLPLGNYTLVASHDRVGDMEQPVSVQAGKPAEVNFDYKAPQD